MLQWEEQDRSSQYLDVELVIQVVVCTAGAKEDFIPSASWFSGDLAKCSLGKRWEVKRFPVFNPEENLEETLTILKKDLLPFSWQQQFTFQCFLEKQLNC